MGLFVNTSSLHNLYIDCCIRDVGETIERDCLSVLHKLHDQVNGLQLVQVVVQPLAKLFNPASLAALVSAQQNQHHVASSSSTTATNPSTSSPPNHPLTTAANAVANSSNSNYASSSNNFATTPIPSGKHQQDSDALSTNSAANHSRSHSFASSFSGNKQDNNNSTSNNSNSSNNQVNNSLLSSTSTYMMSPDTAQALIARLDTDRDVNWLMEIIGYGLSMPFSLSGEQDSVKDCCTIYCEWLAAALLPYNEQNEDTKYQQLSKLVPAPIRMEPNKYARKMLSHLYNVFLPRQNLSTTNYHSSGTTGSGKDQSDTILTAVSRQAVLCHRVLRTIESIAQNQTNLMDDETWDHLLALLLTVNDKLLSAPTEPDDIGTQLHDRILGVLFDLMLLASAKSIPNSSLWKTFHELSLNWRHRPALVDHWRRVTLLLTKRIVLMPSLIKTNQQDVGENSSSAISSNNNGYYTSVIDSAITSMNMETLSQTWFRFLNLIGNPIELSDPNVISRTDEFYHAACSSDNVLDPRQHPCLNALPQIFLNSMLGLKDFIESFLGSYQVTEERNDQASFREKFSKSGSMTSSNRQHQFQSTQQRPSLNSLSSRTSQTQQPGPPQFKYSPDRPKINSIMHIFGDWLFSAALIGSDLNQEIIDPNDGSTSESATSFGSASTTTEFSGMRSYSPSSNKKQPSSQSSQIKSQTSISRRQSQSSKHQDGTSSVTSNLEKITLDPPLSSDSFESGQAEAMALLCRIFSSKAFSEDISPTYLSRFYLCLQHCLTFASGQSDLNRQANTIKRQLLAGVLVNSTTILQKDLDGINLLVPTFIEAIKFVFDCSDRETPIQPPPRQHNRSGSIRSGANSHNSNNITNYDLRRACILTLMNLLAYPYHFRDLVIRNCLNDSSPTTTFGSLRPRLLKLLFIALQTETDPTNMQILFGGLSLTIHDLAKNSDKLVTKNSREDMQGKSRRKSDSNNSSNSNHNSLDAANQQDDTTSQSSFVFNSEGGFLVKSLHVTCHLLINVWKHDTQVSLAALELLTTIARVSTNNSNLNDPIGSQDARANSSKLMNNNNPIEMRDEYKQTTKWICDYICNQCSRPPPAHSRDMHSTIVAAYQCLSVWFYNHPYLLNDDGCVNTLMEVIELGVCGQKSKLATVNPTTGLANVSVTNKGDKVMKPSSMRVREAAESLLNICIMRARMMDDFGHRMTLSYDTVLDEQTLVKLFDDVQIKTNSRHIQDDDLKLVEAHKSFKYFSDDDSIIYGFFEGPNQDSSSKDSVVCLMRTPFGKHCWRMKFVYYTDKTREKIMANKTLGLIKRPFQQVTTPTFESKIFAFPGGHNKSLYFNSTAKFFPETIEVLPKNELDQLVTTLDDYFNYKTGDQQLGNDLDKIGKIFTHQILAEQKVLSECSIRIKRVDCEEPQASNNLEAARVLASHLGLKTALCTIDKGDRVFNNFVEDLKSLDHQSAKTCDSVNIFYVMKNKTSPREILESVRERHNVSLAFFEWILELGTPTVVKNHGRWTGKASSSWNSRSILLEATTAVATANSKGSGDNDAMSMRNQMLTSDHGGAIFDGDRMTLYWTDMCQELAFMVPHKLEKIGDVNIIICWLECSDDLHEVPIEILSSPAQQSQDSIGSESEFKQMGDTNSNPPNPSGTSNSHSRKSRDHATYYISTMKNGLYRVNLTTSFGRNWLALPLVDGMTVSKGILSSLIRESVLNLCRRRKLDADSYQPPHVKRRLKIQDICNNYKISSRYESNEYYNNTLKSKTTI